MIIAITPILLSVFFMNIIALCDCVINITTVGIMIKNDLNHCIFPNSGILSTGVALLLLLVLVFVPPPPPSPARPLPPPSRGMLCDGVRAEEGLCKL